MVVEKNNKLCYCVMWVMGYRGSREGSGTQLWLESISCAVPFIPLRGCGINQPLCVGVFIRLPDLGKLLNLFFCFLRSCQQKSHSDKVSM